MVVMVAVGQAWDGLSVACGVAVGLTDWPRRVATFGCSLSDQPERIQEQNNDRDDPRALRGRRSGCIVSDREEDLRKVQPQRAVVVCSRIRHSGSWPVHICHRPIPRWMMATKSGTRRRD